MDDNTQNSNPNPAPETPAEPTQPADIGANAATATSEPATATKCERCGGGSDNGMCKSCNMANADCTCPAAPVEGGSAPGAPAV